MKNIYKKLKTILRYSIFIIFLSICVFRPKIKFVDKIPSVIETGGVKFKLSDNVIGLYASYDNLIIVEIQDSIFEETRTLFHELTHWFGYFYCPNSLEKKIDDWLDKGQIPPERILER